MRTLHERIGGDEAIAAVVDDLFDRLTRDPLVLHHFAPGRIDSLKAGQRTWFRSVLGGGGDDERPDLAAAHAHLQITDTQVRAVLEHLDAALAATGVPSEPRRQTMSVVTRLWLARTF